MSTYCDALYVDEFRMSDSFIQYRHDFLSLCKGSTLPVHTLCLFLSIVVRWSIWSIDKGRGGEFFKTAKGFEQDGLNRWGYEQARKWFAEMGIIEWRRRGWCGIMHWRVNFKRLYELVMAQKATNASKAEKTKPAPREVKDKLTAIKLPTWVDAEMFELHLHQCHQKHRSVNKETQRGKVKQLELARRKGHDIHQMQAQAVGGGWLNFYVPDMAASVPEEPCLSPTPEEIHQLRMKEQAEYEEQARRAASPEKARAALAGIFEKLKSKHHPPDSG